MKSISFYINNGKERWRCENLTVVYNRMGRDLVLAARHYLDQKGKNATGNLRKSVDFQYSVDDKNVLNISFTYEGADYWMYVEYGVGGALGGPENKAPDSPFSFGSGSGRKGGLRGAIDRWVITKKLPGFRDAKGRFVPRKQQVARISRKIYLYGIKPTPFSEESLTKVYERYKPELELAMQKDVTAHFEKVTAEPIIITISL
jgi:hypothetical protein